jgi:hypothetical protein
LEDAILAFGKEVYLMGTVAPGATIRVELTSERHLSGYLKDLQRRYLDEPRGNRDFRINRADLMLAVMFHDSESTLASERVLSSNPLHDVDLSGQLALQRPMLVARIQRPGSRIVLDNPPSPHKIDQATMVRIILPLKKVKPAS